MPLDLSLILRNQACVVLRIALRRRQADKPTRTLSEAKVMRRRRILWLTAGYLTAVLITGKVFQVIFPQPWYDGIWIGMVLTAVTLPYNIPLSFSTIIFLIWPKWYTWIPMFGAALVTMLLPLIFILAMAD